MESVNLEGFLRRATPYERWRAPLDPKLRRAVILSGISIVTTLVALWTLPALLPLSDSDFFLVLGPQFGRILAAMHQAHPILVALNLISAAVYATLLATTQGLRVGRAVWHWAAFGEVTIGAMNGFILALEVTIVAINLALWIVIITLAIVGALGLLAGMASSSSS